MMKLYDRSPFLPWTVALLLLLGFIALDIIAMLATAAALGLNASAPAHLAAALALPLFGLLPLWMTAANFFCSPLLRLVGALRYVSPYLVVTRSGKGHLHLHGASLFDYLLLFRWTDRGPPAVRKILAWYVEGLLALAREVEQGRIPPETVLCATSYIFSASTARRFGFKVERASRFSFGGLLTYPTQLVTYSFAQGRWTLPPVAKAKRATITGAALSAHTARLQRLRERLLEPTRAAQHATL